MKLKYPLSKEKENLYKNAIESIKKLEKYVAEDYYKLPYSGEYKINQDELDELKKIRKFLEWQIIPETIRK